MTFLTVISWNLFHRASFSEMSWGRHKHKYYKEESILLKLYAVGVDLQLNLKMISQTTLIYSHLQKILEKIPKLRKSCNHKRNINRIYNEKMHYYCLQQMPNLRLKKLGNSSERKSRPQTKALYPVFSLKVRFDSCLIENN